MRLIALFQRQSCPGGAYYVCQNGFTGCCSVNPCDPGGTCPDTATTSAAASSKPTSSTSIKSSTTPTAARSTTTARASTTQSPTITSSSSVKSSATATAAKSTTTARASTTQSSAARSPTSTSASTNQNAQQSSSSNKPGKSDIGTIVGGVIGGVAVIVLCILLLVICIRRKRKRVEEITSATQKSYESPKEAQTGDALFAPLGGFYRGQHSEADKFHHTASNHPQPTVAESSISKVRPQSSSGPSELDSNPIPVEMDGTSVLSLKSPASTIEESPVLARFNSGNFGPGRASNLVDDVRRRQHIMSWNNYDSREAVSPPASMSHGLSPKVGSPDVSPLP